MKKSLILFVLIALIVLIIGPYAPYWVLMIGVAIVSFVVGAGKVSSFFSSGLSFGLAWLGLTLYISIKTDSELPKRISDLMGLENESMLMLGTALLGFVIGAFSGLTGTMSRRMIERKD